ncbi:SDR family NAD(P)-dependent oxidoreductase [Corynebacterium sp.]|uniref:SDR family NAD(P)-dependent oxidoreductase n=1 Tax=Corynebacterium sp. TaxID=1720 RepID=UPI0028ADA24D|nr:SDR family NAD(P)-dependent oxidoreductase [Corynebacterium sp.]
MSGSFTALLVLTSHDDLGGLRSTGYYVGEAAEPWKVFTDAGGTVDIVSIAGGHPPEDGRDDADPVQQAFLGNPRSARQLRHTRSMSDVDPDTYDIVFFVGGHGTMWDFPRCPDVIRVGRAVYEAGGVVAAVCHGPAALVNLTLSDGTPLVAGKRLTSFTNSEEAAVGLTSTVPFLLADALAAAGATHTPGEDFTENVVADGRLVTGQNPQSAAGAARAALAALGRRTVLVTGASSGIGHQVCAQLATAGHSVHAVARRADRLDELAGRYPGVTPWAVDLRDDDAVRRLSAEVGPVDDIVHAAGGARGSTPVIDADTDDWTWMWRTNVLGTMFVLRQFVPRLVDQHNGTVVVVTSVAAFEALDGSAGYSTSKHAQSAMVSTLRNELLGTGVNVTEIAPGLVDTEFFTQRFPDDPDRARRIVDGLDPLTPHDVARAIIYALDQPTHVNIDRIVLRPTAQGTGGRFDRR